MIDWLFNPDASPSLLLFGLVAGYVVGTLSCTALFRIAATETRKRSLMETPQVWEPRTIEIDQIGITQRMTTSKTLLDWSGVGPIEKRDDFLLLWFSRFNVVVPMRAFSSPEDAQAFEHEARRLARAG